MKGAKQATKTVSKIIAPPKKNTSKPSPPQPKKYSLQSNNFNNDLYKDIFIDLVVEAHLFGNSFYPTEKIARAIMCKKPFIVMAPLFYLEYLKQMGFKTFNKFWSEDYDHLGANNRYFAILTQLDYLASLTQDQLLELNKQIEQAKQQVIELNKINTDGAKQNADRLKAEQKQTEETTKGLTDKQKELIEQSAQLIQGVSDNVFNVLNAQVQAYIAGLDKAIDKSKSALDEIRSNSENYNARQLEIEKERLEKLEAERARAVEREKNLAQVQVAINAAIAISKAAAEGGGVASAITIALTLASLVAGLAQARVAAGNAFFHGVEYLERGQNKAGRDTIPAMLNEGERVITTDTNNKYWDVLSAVHNNRIPADVLNTFSKAYQQGGIKNALGAFGDNVSLSSELGQKSIFVNVAQTYGGLENRLERIENVLTELPKYMPRTTVSANANGIFRIVEQRQARKNFSKNWSK